MLLSAGTLIGDDIVNPAGESLGKLEEIMLDVSSGKTGYAVISFGGVMGIGDKLFALPWETLQVDTTNRRLVLDVPRERLEQAPGFDKDNWPDTAGSQWSELTGYWNSDRPARA